jgi:hypothetical protein
MTPQPQLTNAWPPAAYLVESDVVGGDEIFLPTGKVAQIEGDSRGISDLQCCNGVIHGIDAVLVPGCATSQQTFLSTYRPSLSKKKPLRH